MPADNRTETTARKLPETRRRTRIGPSGPTALAAVPTFVCLSTSQTGSVNLFHARRYATAVSLTTTHEQCSPASRPRPAMHNARRSRARRQHRRGKSTTYLSSVHLHPVDRCYSDDG